MKVIAMWFRLLCASVMFTLAGCAGTPLDQALRSGSYPLTECQSVALSRAVSVRYDSFADSRCPKNAMCVWAGKVSYRFTLTSPSGNESFALDYEGQQFSSATLPGVSFGISFAGVRERPVGVHAVVLDVALK